MPRGTSRWILRAYDCSNVPVEFYSSTYAVRRSVPPVGGLPHDDLQPGMHSPPSTPAVRMAGFNVHAGLSDAVLRC
jgi:hypothetical protein